MKSDLWKYALLALSLLALLLLLVLPGRGLESFMKSGEELDALLAGKEESGEPLTCALFLDDCRVVWDQAAGRAYALFSGKSSPKVHIEDNDLRVAFEKAAVDEDFVAENRTLSLCVYNDDVYSRWELYFTTLPLISVTTDGNPIEKETDSAVSFRLIGGETGEVTSKGLMHVRGATSSGWPKKGYKLTLSKDSLGGNARDDDRPILGMREDEDWILYAAYNDQEKVRNVFSTALWKNAAEENNAFHVTNANEFRYVELFLDGAYQGLYALGNPIDKKSVGLREGEYLYKSIGRVAGTYQESEEAYLNFEVKGGDTEKSETWEALFSYFGKIDRQDPTLNGELDHDSLVDYLLFGELIAGADNTYKNIYITAKKAGNDVKYLFTPWDFDYSWGNIWIDDHANLSTGVYERTPDDEIRYLNTDIARYVAANDPDFIRSYKERYASLRRGAWSDEAVGKLIDQYEKEIFSSGAFLRDAERWPDSFHSEASDDLADFRNYVFSRLSWMDQYVENRK